MSLNIITVDDIIACFKHFFKLGNSLKALKSLLLVGDNEIGLLHDVAYLCSDAVGDRHCVGILAEYASLGHIVLFKLSCDILSGSVTEYQRFKQGVGSKTVVSVNACVRALADSVKTVYGGLRIDIYVYAAHKVVLAGENGDKILRHINTLGHKEIVYHGEAVAQVFLTLVSDIEIELVAVCLSAFENNGAGNNISGSKLKAFVIIVHEAFLVAVEQICALASYGLGNKEALS